MTIQAREIQPENEQRWEDATFAANAWRGKAIQLFAQAELAVSEALVLLAATPGRGERVRMRRLVGQRFEDLAEALTGAFAEEGARAADALKTFRQHEELRPLLCHGAAKLAIDRNGRWLIVLKLIAFRARATEHVSRTIEEREADHLLTHISDDCRKLLSALQSLRSRVRSPAG